MEAKRRLREMGYVDLLTALESQDDGDYAAVPFAERIKIAVDVVRSAFAESKIRGLIKRANLRYENAGVHLISLVEERKLNRTLLLELSACAFIDGRADLVFQGFTGSGKAFSLARL